jgi:hypothetical protein
VVSASAVALTLTGVVGSVAGAVYSPDVSTLPTVKFPPDAPFTSQETWVLEEPLTVPVNRWVDDVSRDAEVGFIVIETGSGTGGGGFPPPAPPPPQANRNAIGNTKKAITDHTTVFLADDLRAKPVSNIPAIPIESGIGHSR